MADGDLPGFRRVRTLERLRSDHDIAGFRNGRHHSPDHWLRDRATASEGISARTYVVCTAGSAGRVVGYHAISTAMEERIALPTARLRRGMPDQIPLLLIGRLAVDHEYQRVGLGSDLLSDGLRRCLDRVRDCRRARRRDPRDRR